MEVHGESLVAVRVGSLVEHQVETAVGCLGGRGGGVEEATGEDVQWQVGRLRRISGGSAGIVEKVRCWRGEQDVWAVEEGCSWGDHGRAGGHGRRRLAGSWLLGAVIGRQAPRFAAGVMRRCRFELGERTTTGRTSGRSVNC